MLGRTLCNLPSQPLLHSFTSIALPQNSFTHIFAANNSATLHLVLRGRSSHTFFFLLRVLRGPSHRQAHPPAAASGILSAAVLQAQGFSPQSQVAVAGSLATITPSRLPACQQSSRKRSHCCGFEEEDPTTPRPVRVRRCVPLPIPPFTSGEAGFGAALFGKGRANEKTRRPASRRDFKCPIDRGLPQVAAINDHSFRCCFRQ